MINLLSRKNLFLIAGIFLLGLPLVLFAQNPCPTYANLSITSGKNTYEVGEPISGEVVFTNNVGSADVNFTVSVTKDGKTLLSREYTVPTVLGRNVYTLKDALGGDSLPEVGVYVIAITASNPPTGCSWNATLTLTGLPVPVISSLPLSLTMTVSPKEYFLTQTVTGSLSVTNPNSGPIQANFSVELYKDSTLLWSRNVNQVSISPGTITVDLGTVFGFQPTIPNSSSFFGNFRLEVKRTDVSPPESASDTFTIRAAALQLTLTIDPNEYELGGTLQGGGALSNPSGVSAPATFRIELFQGATLRWQREVSVTVPPGNTPFTLSAVFGFTPTIPSQPSLGGDWTMKITQVGVTPPVQVQAGFRINTPVTPTPKCSNGVDDDSDGKIDYPADPGCTGPSDNDETDPPPPPPSFNYNLSNSGGITVVRGQSGSNTITATLISGSTRYVGSLGVAGLPTGATGVASLAQCMPTCSFTLTIYTSPSTPSGTYSILVTASPLGKSTSFTLIINPGPFGYSLSNLGNLIAYRGTQASNNITATLTSGSSQPVSFSVSIPQPLASFITASSFSQPSCSPTCTTTLYIMVSPTFPYVGQTYVITVTGSPLGNTTSFTVQVF